MISAMPSLIMGFNVAIAQYNIGIGNMLIMSSC